MYVLILAAGEGTRLKSRRPKVLHRVAGRPLVAHVARAALALEPDSLVVVGPAELEPLRRALDGLPVGFAVQDPPAGTADAVAVGCAALDAGSGTLLVLNGDTPCIRATTLEGLLEVHSTGGGPATILTHRPDDPTGYGRIVRREDGSLRAIVEESDASEEELAIPEVNAGVYCFDLASLRRVLDDVEADNAQGELYLPDAVALLEERGEGAVRAVLHDDSDELHGINTRAELARAEEILRRRILEGLMEGGVTVRDPASTYVDVDVEVGADTILHPNTVLESGTRIGERCAIYPNARLARCNVGDDVTVWDSSVLEDCRVADGVDIGPFARLRPGADIGEGARVGNFVEVKKSRMGPGSKANHLSYLGDAEIGAGVNVGAGTITCNYDGVKKHRAVIEDGAFIGSNTALVAPVRIGRGAYVGAGSTITDDVPAKALGLARGRQVNKLGWADGAEARRRAVREGDGDDGTDRDERSEGDDRDASTGDGEGVVERRGEA